MASRSLGVLTLDLVMKTGGFKQGADSATREFQKMNDKINRTAGNLVGNLKNIGAGIIGGIGIASIIQETAAAEKALAKLDNAVQSNGGAAGRTTAQLDAMSVQLQRVSIFADEAIQTAQSLLLRFKSISGVNFDRATGAVLDLASALDKDLSTVALQLGRALESPDEGLKKLARSGVIFSEAQKAVVKEMVESGNVAQAQTFILDELEKKFGGAAEAARNNFSGALQGLKNALGDLLEAKGGLPETVAKINEVTDALSSREAQSAASSLTSALVNGLGAIGKAATALLLPIANLVNAASDAGARIDRFLFGRTFADETEKRLFSLKARIQEVADQRDRLVRGGSQFDLPEINSLNNQLDRLESQRSKGPTTRARVTRSDIKLIDEENADYLAQVAEDNVTALEKLQRQLDVVKQKNKEGILVGDEYTKAVVRLNAEIAKASKSGTASKTAESEAQKATKAINDQIDKLNLAAASYGKTDREAFALSLTTGDLADKFAAVGAAADPLRDKLQAAFDSNAAAAATDAIGKQIDALYEQTAVLGLTERQALEYNLAQGDMARQLGLTGEAAEEWKAKWLAAYDGLLEKQKQVAAEDEVKTITLEFRTDSEKFEAEITRLSELFAQAGGDQTTLGRAVGASVIEYTTAATAVEEYQLRLNELADLLASGKLSPEAYVAAVEGVEEVFAEAGRKAGEAFRDEAKRNTQNIVADFLEDPFSRGIKGLVEDFDKMFRQIAAQALAAKIADKIFAGFDSWIDKALASMAQLGSSSGGSGILGTIISGIGSHFGGGASTGGFEDIIVTAKRMSEGGFTGPGAKLQPAGIVHAMEYVMPMERVTEPGALPFLRDFHARGMSAIEEHAPRLRGYAMGGLVAPTFAGVASRMAGNTSTVASSMTEESVLNVTNNFYIDAPSGTVGRQTQQQIAASAARGLARANRRNN